MNEQFIASSATDERTTYCKLSNTLTDNLQQAQQQMMGQLTSSSATDERTIASSATDEQTTASSATDERTIASSATDERTTYFKLSNG